MSHGQVIGATDPSGGEVIEDAVGINGLMCTIASAVGMDPTLTRVSPKGDRSPSSTAVG